MNNIEIYAKIIGLAVTSAVFVGILTGIALYWLKDKFVTKDIFNQHITAHATDITHLKAYQIESKLEIKQFTDKIENLKEWISERLKQQDTNTMKELMHINNNIRQYVNSNTTALEKLMELEDKIQELEVKLAKMN